MRFNFLTKNKTVDTQSVKLSASYPIYFASFLGRSSIDEYIMKMIHSKSKIKRFKQQNIVEFIYVRINDNFRPFYTKECFDEHFDLKPLSDNIKENLVMNYVLSNYLFLDELGFGEFLKELNKDTSSIVRYRMNGEYIDDYIEGCEILINVRFVSKDLNPDKNKNYIPLKTVTKEVAYICEVSNKNEKESLLETSLSAMGFYSANLKSIKEYLSDIPEPEKVKLFSDRVYTTCYINLCNEIYAFYCNDVMSVNKHWSKIFSIFQFKGQGANKNQSILYSEQSRDIVTHIKFELKNNTTSAPGGVEEDLTTTRVYSDNNDLDIENYKLTVFELRKLKEILQILDSDNNPTSIEVKDVDYFIKEIAISKIESILTVENRYSDSSPIDFNKFFANESLSVVDKTFSNFMRNKSSKYYFPSGMFFLDELLIKSRQSGKPLLENKNKNADRDILNVWLTLNWLHPLILKLGNLIYLEKISINNFTVKDILENVRIPAFSSDKKRYTLTETLEFANTVKSIYKMDYKNGSNYKEDTEALRLVNGKCNMNATEEHLYLESIKNAPRSSNSSVYTKTKRMVDSIEDLSNSNLYVESETDLSLYSELEDNIHLPSAMHLHGYDRAGGNRVNIPELSKLNTNSSIDYDYLLIGNKRENLKEIKYRIGDLPLNVDSLSISSKFIPNVTYTSDKLDFTVQEIKSRQIQCRALFKLLGGVDYEPEYLKNNFLAIYRVMLEKMWLNCLGNTQYCMLKNQNKKLNEYYNLLVKCFLYVRDNGFLSEGLLDELLLSGRDISPNKTDDEMLSMYRSKSIYIFNERFSYREVQSAKRKLLIIYKSRLENDEELKQFIEDLTHRVSNYNYYSDAYKNKMPGFKEDVYNFYNSSFRAYANDISEKTMITYNLTNKTEPLTKEESAVLDIDEEDCYKLNLRNVEDRLLYVNDVSEEEKKSGTYSRKSRNYIPFYNPQDDNYYGDATDKYLSNKIENVLDNNYRFLGIGDIPYDFYNLKLGTEMIAENLFLTYVERERMLMNLYRKFITSIYTSTFSERINEDGLSKLSMQAIKGLDRSAIGRDVKYFNKIFVAEKKKFISSYKMIAGIIAHLDLNKFSNSTEMYDIIKDYLLGSSELYFISGLRDNRESLSYFPEYLLERVLKRSVFYLGRCAIKTKKDDSCTYVFQRIYSQMKSSSTTNISSESLNKMVKDDFLKAKENIDDFMTRARITLSSFTETVRQMLPIMNIKGKNESTINPNGYSPVLQDIWNRTRNFNFKYLGTTTNEITDACHRIKSLIKSYIRNSSLDSREDFFSEMLYVNGSPLIFSCNCYCKIDNKYVKGSGNRDDSEFLESCTNTESFIDSRSSISDDFIDYFRENDINDSSSFIVAKFFCTIRFREGAVPCIVPLCPKSKNYNSDLKEASMVIPQYFTMNSDSIILDILREAGELIKEIENGDFII